MSLISLCRYVTVPLDGMIPANPRNSYLPFLVRDSRDLSSLETKWSGTKAIRLKKVALGKEMLLFRRSCESLIFGDSKNGPEAHWDIQEKSVG